ncbi:MAG: DUF4743 domain-containing protein [Gammaproteobacteria bacterium]
MSFLDRIHTANRYDLGRYLPFYIAGIRVGYVKTATVERLRAWPEVFTVRHDRVALAAELDRPDAAIDQRTEAVDEVLRSMHASGAITGWRDEPYPVAATPADPALMRIERSALPVFGISGAGVHMNGFVLGPSGKVDRELRMWVARRARDKPTWPGAFDQIVAGGQPAGLGVRENLAKECWEEAGIVPGLASCARAAGSVTYVYELDAFSSSDLPAGPAQAGLRPDIVYCFDLELPADFEPVARDGEVESFELWSLERVMATVEQTDAFKFNCSLVIIDFLLRHGFIGPEHPQYVQLCQGLHRSLD